MAFSTSRGNGISSSLDEECSYIVQYPQPCSEFGPRPRRRNARAVIERSRQIGAHSNARSASSERARAARREVRRRAEERRVAELLAYRHRLNDGDDRGGNLQRSINARRGSARPRRMRASGHCLGDILSSATRVFTRTWDRMTFYVSGDGDGDTTVAYVESSADCVDTDCSG